MAASGHTGAALVQLTLEASSWPATVTEKRFRTLTVQNLDNLTRSLFHFGGKAFQRRRGDTSRVTSMVVHDVRTRYELYRSSVLNNELLVHDQSIRRPTPVSPVFSCAANALMGELKNCTQVINLKTISFINTSVGFHVSQML